MAQTIRLHGYTATACPRDGTQRAEAPDNGTARLLARTRSAARAILAALGTYLPWSNASLRGWKTSLDIWRPLGEAPRARVRRRGNRAEI